MERERDLSFEALVEVTGANISAERGALNRALMEIRSEMEDVDDPDLAEEIRFRAAAYRRAWPTVALTPTALSKHWSRIQMEAQTPTTKVAAVEPEQGWWLCGLCQNDGWVFVAGTNDTAPCPECNRGRKAEIAAYRREGGFWENRNWVRGEGPQEVVVS